MRWLKRLLLVILLVTLGICLWIYFHPDPRKVIRKELINMAQIACIKSDDNQFVRLADAQKLPEFFSAEARIILDIPQVRQHTLEGRDDITEASMLLKSRIRSVKIEFVDINVALGTDKKSAQADLTAKITYGDDPDLNAQELKFLLKQSDGRWLVTRVETVKPFN